VLGRDDADAVGRAGGRAQRAADALLQPRVFEAVQLVAPAEARVHGDLLLRILVDDRALDEPPERRLQPAQRLAERAVEAAGAAGLGPALHGDHVVAGRRPASDLDRVRVRHQSSTTTRTAVTSALAVASGRRTFQPRDISWS